MEIKPIRGVIALLTNQCNLACPYCFEQRDVQTMSLDTAKKLVDFVAPQNSPHITLFGGEPTLMWDSIIVPLTKYAEEKGVRLNMTTNGTLLTPERVDFLIDHNITFLLSMDGCKATQDSNRPMRSGGSSFDAIPMDYVLSKRPSQPFRGTITPNSVESLYEDVLFFERSGVKDLGYMPDYFQTWNEESLKTLSEQIRLLEEHILQSFRSGTLPLLMRAYYVAFADIFRLQKQRERRTSPDCLKGNQCGLGVSGNCSSDVYGNLYACHHIAPLTPESEGYIGHVYDGLDKSRVMALIERYDAQKVGGEKCKSCPLDPICYGGCKSNNYMICGDMHEVPEMYCYWQRSITDSAYRISVALGNEQNEFFIKTFDRWKGIRA